MLYLSDQSTQNLQYCEILLHFKISFIPLKTGVMLKIQLCNQCHTILQQSSALLVMKYVLILQLKTVLLNIFWKP